MILDVSGSERRLKIPPNGMARMFAVMTIMDARKRKLWPWRSARGARSTGGIFVYLRPREEVSEAFPLRSSMYG